MVSRLPWMTGDGGAQLVADVGEKHPLGGERGLQPVEHAVERGR
jgi:hypothetical protein